MFITEEKMSNVIIQNDFLDCHFDDEKSKKLKAYYNMEAMKKLSHFPVDYDYNAVRDEAFAEKYGNFN